MHATRSPVAVLDERLYGVRGNLSSSAIDLRMTDFPKHIESRAHSTAHDCGGVSERSVIVGGVMIPMKYGGGTSVETALVAAMTGGDSSSDVWLESEVCED